MGLKLNVACGWRPLKGFVNIDGDPACDPDVIVDLDTVSLLSLYKSGSVEYIEARNIIEHFSHWNGVELLRDFYTLLQPGGQLRVETYDFESVVKSNMPILDKLLALFGGRDTLQANKESRRKFPQYYCHKYAYTKNTLATELKAVGFQIVKIISSQISCSIMASKL